MKLTNCEVEVRGQSQKLVLLVPAWRMGVKSLADVRRAITDALPDADLLSPDFPGSTFSKEDPVALANEYLTCIDQAVSSRLARGQDYQEIIFVGHSLGALLTRKIYVFARGENHELRAAGLQPIPRVWASKITRIVLLAGMNRGWSVSPKPEKMSWVMALFARMFLTILHVTRTRLAGLIRSIQRGSPFIANLRVQWINLVRSGTQMPLTVQLLGEDDELVAREDNIDLQSGRDFVYLNLPSTIHKDAVFFDGKQGEARKTIFLRALLTSAKELKSEYEIPKQQQPDTSVNALVFVMHGIRDFGDWTINFGRYIEKNFPHVKAVTSSYGRFPMSKFLLWGERQKNVRWFMDQYTENLARYPAARTISFVGHSNGTYLLASALMRYAACRFENVVFAGSVARRDFPWDRMVASNRIRRIRNYVGTNDKVVGIFPHVFELLDWSDLGSAGLHGFTDEEGHRYAINYISGSHGAALVEDNFKAMANFLLGSEDCEVVPRLLSQKQEPFTLLLSKLCWLDWIVLISLILAVFLALWWRSPLVAVLYAILVICGLNFF